MNPTDRRDALKLLGGALAWPLVSGGVSAADVPDSSRRPRIKIGQIGVGHGHASKVAVYRASADYEVVGIVEPDPALRKSAETQAAFRGLRWMTQEELLQVPGLQAVLVETHVRDLLNVGETCLAAGKHIALDKPAGASLPQFRRLLDAAAQRKLLVQMGYMYRYNPGVQLLRQILQRGWLGEVFEVHAVMSKVVDFASRQTFAEFSGGILFELGGHLVDLVVGVLGKPTRVTSVAQQVARTDDSLRDNMLAVLEYPRAVATVKSSALEVEGFDRRHLVVCGTQGTLQIQPLDNPSVRLALSTAQGGYRKGYQDVPLPQYSRYIADAADMARIVRGEKAADYSPEHDLIVQATLLQACGMPVD